MRSKTVIVTGSSGYIGSVLCERLKELGYNPVGFEKAKYPFQAKDHPTLFDFDKMIGNIYYSGVDKVIHLAAKSVPISESVTNPLDYYDNNPGFTAKLLNQLQKAGWKGDIVFASSAAVYKESLVSVNEQTSIIDPPTHYGRSKLMCEEILQSATVNGIRTTAFRFFNVAGSYKKLGDRNEHVLVRVCESAKAQTPFVINGSDYPTIDGTCVRDYVHVVDICDAMIAAMQRMALERELDHYKSKGFYEAYNLGTHNGTSLLQLVQAFNDSVMLERKLDVIYGPRRPGDVPYLVANPTKFVREYDFQYKHSLPDMLRSAWSQFEENTNAV